MITVSAFSPLSFYARAKGTPLSNDEILEPLYLSLPKSSGPTLLRLEEPSTPRAILAALYADTAERARVIDTIKSGEIPPITPSPLSAELPILRVTPSLGHLHESSIVLVDFLGLVPPLAERAYESSRSSCPTCGATTILSRNTSDLAKDAVSRWSGERATVEVHAPHAHLAQWGETRGFTVQKISETHHSLRIDSFMCDEEEFQKRHTLISSALHIPEASVQIRCKDSIRHYARGGWCSACAVALKPTSIREIKAALTRGKGDALLSMLGDITLERALAIDIHTLVAQRECNDLLPSQILGVLQNLELDTLPLGRPLHSLSPQSLSTLTLFATLSKSTSPNICSIVDIPLSLYSETEAHKLTEASRTLSRGAPLLWVSDDPTSAKSAAHTNLNPDAPPKIGEISFTGPYEARFDITVGGIITVPRSPDTSHERRALTLVRALHGQSTPSVCFRAQGEFSAKLVECFSPPSSHQRLVAHDLGAVEPIAKLFAASHQAKMLGLSSKDFIIGQAKGGEHVCPSCRGAGIALTKSAPLSPPIIGPCARCWGTRFRSPVREITFKGRTLWEILNLSIAESSPTLKALPKMSQILQAADLLSLSSIPLGMPVAALSNEQQRNLAILRAMLTGTRTKPVVIVLEEPFVRLSPKQQESLREALTLSAFKEKVSWLLV